MTYERDSPTAMLVHTASIRTSACGAKNHHPMISIKLPDGTWDRHPQTAHHTMNVYRAERAYDRLPGNMSGVLSYFWVLANTPAV